MLRAAIEVLTKLEGWVTSAGSRMKKLVGGTGGLGHRAAPAQAGNNDASIGGRIDFGKKFTGEDGQEYQRFKFQLNENASNPTLREAARKNPHKTWAEGDIAVGAEPKKETFEDFFKDLKEDLKSKIDG